MKFVTYYIMGLGGQLKENDVKELVKKQQANMLCLQETKMKMLDKRSCASLWDGGDFDWVFKPTVGLSGGLLIMWDSSIF